MKRRSLDIVAHLKSGLLQFVPCLRFAAILHMRAAKSDAAGRICRAAYVVKIPVLVYEV